MNSMETSDSSVIVDLLNVLKEHDLDDNSIRSLFQACYDEVLEHRLRITAHLFYLLDNYFEDGYHGIKLLKHKVKKWTMETYYESREIMNSEAKKFFSNLVKAHGIQNVDYTDYDIQKINDIQVFIRMEYDNAKIIDQNFAPENTKVINTTIIPEKISFSDFKNITFGSTCITGSSKGLKKLHDVNKFQEKQHNNREELEFSSYVHTYLNTSIEMKSKITKFWNMYKDYKINDFLNIKIRNKHIHFLYIYKLVTNISFDRIIACVSSSPLYLSKIKIKMLCDLTTHKLHTSLENSFDKFFSSYYFENITDPCIRELRDAHEEGKKVKFKVDDKFYRDLVDVKGHILTEEKIKQIKNKIETDIINNNQYKNIIYNICKSESVKVTKKQIESFLIKYY